MSVSVFINYPGPESAAGALLSAFRTQALDALRAASGLQFVESYVPAPGGVPEFQEGERPPLILEINLDELEDASRMLESAALRAALRLGEHGDPGIDVFHAVHFPLQGRPEPPPRTATLSFVVRYFLPVADQAEFVSFYTSHHPLLETQFPGIRNILCYLPTGAPLPQGIQSSGAFFGNEVVFDDMEALNAALASDVLPRMRAEGKLFPKYGHSRHHAMLRQREHHGEG